MFKGGIYTISIPGVGTYYGESANIKKRWAVHRKQLYNRTHHCIRLRDAVKALGMEHVRFEVIAQSEILDKSAVARAALEQYFINKDPNALNSVHNTGSVTPESMPNRDCYRNKSFLYLKRVTRRRKLWVKVEAQDGSLIGMEPLSKAFRLGKFSTDEKCRLKRIK